MWSPSIKPGFKASVVANRWLAIFLAGTLGIAFVAFSPGLLNADSIDMLNQAVVGRFHDWHSPLMSFIWSLANHVIPGPAGMLFLQQAMYLTGIYLILTALFPWTVAAIGAATITLAVPPLFATLAYVNKDSFALALFALTVGLFSADLCRANSRSLTGWVVSGALACAIRIDYLPYLFCFFAARIWITVSRPAWGHSAQWSFLSVIGAATTSIAGGLFAALTIAGLIGVVNYDLLKSSRRHSLQATFLHDIAGISVSRQSNLFPQWIKDRGVTTASIRTRYSALGGDSLFWGGDPQIPRVPFTVEPAELRDLRAAWIAAVTAYPTSYLQHRRAVFRCLVKSCTDPIWNYQYDTDPRFPSLVDYDDMGLSKPLAGAAYRSAYLHLASGTMFSSGSAYLWLLAVCLLVIMTGPRIAEPGKWTPSHRRLRLLALTLGFGSATHLGALALVTPAALFRYLTPMFLVAVVLFFSALLVIRDTAVASRIPSWIPSLTSRE